MFWTFLNGLLKSFKSVYVILMNVELFKLGGSMKFTPCQPGQCTEGGTNCMGCGCSHAEIAKTKKLVSHIVEFSRKQKYDNVDDFAAFINKNLLKKLHDSVIFLAVTNTLS